MHILTKIFVVLVSLLTAALVPLVVVHTTNEDTYKSRWQGAQANATAAQNQLTAERASRSNAEASAQLKEGALESQLADVQKSKDALQARVTQLDSELVASRARETSVQADLKVLAESHRANTALTESLVNETRQLRTDLLDSNTKLVELDEVLRDVRIQLEVADAARRALQVEVQRLKDANATAMAQVASYEAKYGSLTEKDIAATVIDRNFEALITNVQRSKDKVLAEVNVGSRDGVREGWELIISDNGKFLGKLRIIEVDVNRSTGQVILEDAKNRGEVTIGNTATAVKGR